MTDMPSDAKKIRHPDSAPCPRCGSIYVLQILYGEPSDLGATTPGYTHGGCVLCSQQWRCSTCEHEWPTATNLSGPMCPECRSTLTETAVIQDGRISRNDMANRFWHCKSCHHEWGLTEYGLMKEEKFFLG